MGIGFLQLIDVGFQQPRDIGFLQLMNGWVPGIKGYCIPGKELPWPGKEGRNVYIRGKFPLLKTINNHHQ